MERYFRNLILALLVLPAAPLHAEFSFSISPSLGEASLSNIDGYDDATYLRIDGTFYPLPQLGVGVFSTFYDDFESSSGGNDIAIALDGIGVGLMGRWPLTPHVQPYLRGDYLKWNAKATGLGRTLARDDGVSLGAAVGVHFPLIKGFGLRAEHARYDDVSGADLRQTSLAWILEF